MGIAWEWHNVDNRKSALAFETERLAAAKAGDRGALERLLSEYEGPLYALCRGMLDRCDDAEDAVQETFLRAIRNIRKFQGKAQLRTWLHRIAVNICLDVRRRHRPAVELATAAERPDQRCLEKDVIHRIRVEKALQSLPPRRRAIFLLKELEGWSGAEIGQIMGCRESLVYYELKEAVRALAKWRSANEGDIK